MHFLLEEKILWWELKNPSYRLVHVFTGEAAQTRTIKQKGNSYFSSFMKYMFITLWSYSSPRCSSCAVLTCAYIGPLTPVPSGPFRSKTKQKQKKAVTYFILQTLSYRDRFNQEHDTLTIKHQGIKIHKHHQCEKLQLRLYGQKFVHPCYYYTARMCLLIHSFPSRCSRMRHNEGL